MLFKIAAHRGRKSPSRIRRKNEQLILSAAEEEFARHGYKGASMNSIAVRAGLPKANIHYYFNSKLELYAAVLSRIIELWDGTLNKLKADDDPAVALPEYIAAKMRFSREQPLASRIFAIEILNGAPNLVGYFDEEYRRWFRSRTEVFRAWAQQGRIAPIDPAHLIFLLWSATQHYADFACQIRASIGKEELTDDDYDSATRTLTQVVLRGCGVLESEKRFSTGCTGTTGGG
ncbi:TetR/AcrR family transcriptional regulator [Povalibacter uvarum]|uniref:TetR/AcrR family transcriptional regulator n=1 Tax=Povalibacter uvarum TaxID=732238 RepID=A0A841HQP4_9GAMM|nr:TetR/AcrR family transcriptional regulator [Povalibacter uvarum]MBB6095537.1 TetR/AcrR family transcriptional regulator [Povalibacter uvarum]